MLSTMALPEMEAEEKGLLSQLDASMAAMSDQELHASLAVCKSCLQQCWMRVMQVMLRSICLKVNALHASLH